MLGVIMLIGTAHSLWQLEDMLQHVLRDSLGTGV